MLALIEVRSALRCSYCHGEARGLLEGCEGCAALFHADCRLELGRCATLGCQAPSVQSPLPSRGAPAPARKVPRPLRLVLDRWFWLAVLFVWGLFGR